MKINKGVILEMKSINLRLNDILEDTPIVSFDNENSEIDKFLYDSVVGAYQYAYINADNKEQFYNEFKKLWNRSIPYHRNLVLAQIAVSENIWKAKIDKKDTHTNLVDTPNYDDTETWDFDTNEQTEHGHTLTITPNITETDKGTTNGSEKQTGTNTTVGETDSVQYSQQITKGNTTTTNTPDLTTTNDNKIDNTHTRSGDETHTNSGTDNLKKTGKNSRILKRTGTKQVEFTDNTTNTSTIYDPEKLYSILRTDNTVDRFIDLFSPLFNDILFFNRDLGGWL